jgi:hypothetical protein
MLRTTSLACHAARTAPRVVTGVEQPQQRQSAAAVEAFVGSGQQSSAPVEPVVLVRPSIGPLVVESRTMRPTTPATPSKETAQTS